MARYTYGDSDLAGDRLALVASLFEPTSRAFLQAVSPSSPTVALDLGCGPGYTTALVRAVTEAPRVIGIDRSAAFARRAHQGSGRDVVVADVALSLPIERAELIYARLLLAHLHDPIALIARWSTSLTISGRVLIDDLEAIETDDDVFRTYLDEVALAVVRAEGGDLFVGPRLHAEPDPPGLARLHDAIVTFEPTPGETARVFAMNLQVLTERGEVSPRPDLASALTSIADGARSPAPVRWHVRQLAWERTG